MRKLEHIFSAAAFEGRGCLRDLSLSPPLGTLMGLEYSRSLGAAKNKRKLRGLAAAPKNLQYCRQTAEGTRVYKLLRKEM